MIIAGLKVSFLGMSAVAIFLLILIMLVKLSYKLLSSLSAMEFAEIEDSVQKRRKKSPLAHEDTELIAIITAAITAHRARAARLPITDEKRGADLGP